MTDHILKIGENCWVRDGVDRAGVLVDGRDYYAMFHEAARRAERYILLSGWQFDSDVSLLRGEAADTKSGDVRLLPFLNELCQRRPDLRIYLLAWDFSVVYALEREWLQGLAFEWTTHKNMRFVFDACIPLEGAHHQKFTVIDGVLGFVGGMDICEHRWDDRSHSIGDPLRTNADGTLYPPYHETHAYVQGAAVAHLVEFFRTRWNIASTDPLELVPRATVFECPPNNALPIAASEVALCRTLPQGPGSPNNEIRALLASAIRAAERLIYVETQYLTARVVADALEERMRAGGRPKLDVVFILPDEPEAAKEALAMGITQARVVARLRAVAQETGHRIGFYCSAAPGPGGADVATYIHSKLLIVDDRFLTLGSANLNNRSMGLDTELNVAFEASASEPELASSLREIRLSLLAEHVGTSEGLASCSDLVAHLDALAAEKKVRLRRYEADDPTRSDVLLDVVSSTVGIYLDPEEPVLQHDLESPARWRDMFSRGISRLKQRLSGATSHPATPALEPLNRGS